MNCSIEVFIMFSNPASTAGQKIENLQAKALFFYQYAQLFGALVFKDQESGNAFLKVVNKMLDNLQYPISNEDFKREDKKIKEIADHFNAVTKVEMSLDSKKILNDFCKFTIRTHDAEKMIHDKCNNAVHFINQLVKDGKIPNDAINLAGKNWYQKPKEYIHFNELSLLEKRFDTGEYEVTSGTFFVFTKKHDESHQHKLWKMHVSVASDQVQQAWDKIIPMLIQKEVAEFKLTNFSEIHRKIASTRTRLEDAVHKKKSQPEIDKLEELLRLQEADFKRVSEGSQITIYVPEGEENNKKYESLLTQIERTLVLSNIKSGEMDLTTDAKIGKFCSARYCKGVYADSTKVTQYKPDDVEDPAFVRQGKETLELAARKRL